MKRDKPTSRLSAPCHEDFKVGQPDAEMTKALRRGQPRCGEKSRGDPALDRPWRYAAADDDFADRQIRLRGSSSDSSHSQSPLRSCAVVKLTGSAATNSRAACLASKRASNRNASASAEACCRCRGVGFVSGRSIGPQTFEWAQLEQKRTNQGKAETRAVCSGTSGIR